MLRIEPTVLCMQGQCSITEPQLQSSTLVLQASPFLFFRTLADLLAQICGLPTRKAAECLACDERVITWEGPCTGADTHALETALISQWRKLQFAARSKLRGARASSSVGIRCVACCHPCFATPMSLKRESLPLPMNEAFSANTSSSCEHAVSSSVAPKRVVPEPKFNFHAYLSPSTLCKHYFVANAGANCIVWIIAPSQP